MLGIVYLDQLKGARHTHISYHDNKKTEFNTTRIEGVACMSYSNFRQMGGGSFCWGQNIFFLSLKGQCQKYCTKSCLKFKFSPCSKNVTFKLQFCRDNQVFWNMYCEENGELCTYFDTIDFIFSYFPY